MEDPGSPLPEKETDGLARLREEGELGKSHVPSSRPASPSKESVEVVSLGFSLSHVSLL